MYSQVLRQKIQHQARSVIISPILNKILCPISTVISKNVEIPIATQITRIIEVGLKNGMNYALETQIHNRPII